MFMHTYGDPVPGTREDKICKLEQLPDDLERAVAGMTDAELDTPYRAGGWTVRQVVHLLADSHINAYVRVRLLLTEHEPTIKPYDQDAWAALPDAQLMPIGISLALFRPLQSRLAAAFRNAKPEDWSRTGAPSRLGTPDPRSVSQRIQLARASPLVEQIDRLKSSSG
jgi:hypothetical protein